ncbi:MAG: NAD-dependent epimerase/dehydratase family protein [Chitinophagaceae bacterium]|nr:MAG: NAD-dependent epimerase/dehydratase family protein [Chitinophagaceae bacterium]
MPKVLITGACGQIGTELTLTLRKRYGDENVVTSDFKEPENEIFKEGKHYKLDVLDRKRLDDILKFEEVDHIYHLAALLSAKGEENPQRAWEINMNGFFNIAEASRKFEVKKVFWPSSIAVFGPTTPVNNTPQFTVAEPTTVYGISKLAGEGWCNYYYHKFGLDIRSLRYPGLISHKTLPGGGTTDYAVDIFHKAVKGEDFECFLEEDTRLPMMYMDDAIRATIELMESPSENIKVRTSYNVTAISFTPKEIYNTIKKFYPEFKITYNPDFRQQIAASWPQSIDDSQAAKDWGWKNEFDLEKMTKVMLEALSEKA